MALTRVPVFLAFQALFSFQDAVRYSVRLAVLSARLSDSLFIIPHLYEFVKRFLKSFFKSFSFSRMSLETLFLTSTSSCVPSGIHRISRCDAVFVAPLECPLDRRLVYYSTIREVCQAKDMVLIRLRSGRSAGSCRIEAPTFFLADARRTDSVPIDRIAII